MAHDWTQEQGLGDWMRSQEKRSLRQERRAGVPKAAAILGPGIAPQAVETTDWSAQETEFNGFFFSRPGAMHTPDSNEWWLGFSFTQEGQWGMQRVWDYRGESSPPAEYTRTFQIMGATRLFTDWANSGVGAETGIRTFHEDEPPFGLDADDIGRAIWYDTNDGDHPYLWSDDGAGGMGWVSMRGDGTEGPQGPPGMSAYQVAVLNGFTGTEAEWLASLEGDQGIPGPDGADGQSLYTWLKYADTPTSGMSNDPTGKTYMGLAYNKTNPIESGVYADYEWSLIQGEGVEGPPGADGQTTYTWIKYGTSATGAGFSDSPVGATHIGIAYNKTTAVESTNPADYEWALIQGPEGPEGPQGPEGPAGEDATVPAPVTPTQTPSISVSGGVTQLRVKIPYQVNPTPAVMDLYVGTPAQQVGGLLPLDATTYHGQTSASLYIIERLPNGTALAPDTDYIVVGRWRSDLEDTTPWDSLLVGPRSADLIVNLSKVSTENVSSLAVDVLESGTLSAAILLAAAMRTADSGPRVENGPEGIKVWGTRTDKPDTTLPTDGSGPDFRGSAELEGATFTGQAAFREAKDAGGAHLDHEWGPGAVSMLRKGTTAPVSAPTPTIDWATVNAYGMRSGYGLGHDGTYFYSVFNNDGTKQVQRHNTATGALVDTLVLGTSTDHVPYGGVTKIGTSYYTLGWKWSVISGYTWSICKWSATTGAKQAELDYTPYGGSGNNGGFDPYEAGRSSMCVGTDGTNLLVADVRPDTGLMRIQHRSATDLTTLSSPATVTTAIGTSPGPVSVMKGTFDFGGTRFVVLTYDNANCYVFDTSGNLMSNEYFPNPANPNADGMCWDGSVFRTYDGTSNPSYAIIHTHTNIRWTTESATWSAKYGWINGAGQETLQSPVKNFTMKKRARVTLTGAALPATATGTSHYVTRSGAANWQKATNTAGNNVTYSTQPTWATAPPTSSTFPDGTPAKHKSDSGGFEVDGLGQGAWPYVQPVGAVTMYGGSTAPPGWLLCDGSTVSTLTYANLFAVIGHKFNMDVSPGSGLFRLPDMVDRFPVGAGAGAGASLLLGRDDGYAKGAVRYDTLRHDHTHSIAQEPNHQHSVSGVTDDRTLSTATNTGLGGTATRLTQPTHNHAFSTTSGGAGSHDHGGTGGEVPDGQAHARQAFNFIIKI